MRKKNLYLITLFVALCLSQKSQSQSYSEPINDIKLNESEKLIQREMKRVETCGHFNDFKYCLYPGTGKNSEKLIYFFHGILGMENIWINNQTYLQMQTEWSFNPEGRPSVVNISYGRIYLLTPKNEKEHSGILDTWTPEFISEFENSVLHLTPQKRFLLGNSMGGHNALNLYIKLFPFFSRLGLMCPAQLLNSPYASREEVEKILPSVESLWPMYLGAMGLMSLYYDEQTWNHLSPFHIEQRKLAPLKNIRMLLMEQDLYGFTVVNKNWIELIKKAGGSAEYQLSSGIHCDPKETLFLSSFLN